MITEIPVIPAGNLPGRTENPRRPVAGARENVACHHCGTGCRGDVFTSAGKDFCCQGCLAVFELLTENGLVDYYNLGSTAGVRIRKQAREEHFRYLDDPSVRQGLVDYSDERLTRVTLHIPAIHCIACVWLLENLFRLKPGIGGSQVNFPRKEVAISFDSGTVKLSEVAALLAGLGYEPELNLADAGRKQVDPAGKRLWMQLGVAGFAFGNTMLFSISNYLGLDSFSGPVFGRLVGYISLMLALPVLLYSSQDYFRLAWHGLRQRRLTIEVPIALGIVAVFLQSTYEVLSGRGEGYFDSFSGLIFFLLCGRLFQQKTYARLAFDRDYKSFFPLCVTRKTGSGEEVVPLSRLETGDRIVLRNGELIPADARLVSGSGSIDYSFVTGESEAVEKGAGDYLYAGGRQTGGAVELEVLKPVSQSYLTSLWNQEAFRKAKTETLDTLINRYSDRFTKVVIAVAVSAAAFWAFREPSRALKAFTSVLIVACPCALALAAPFALGTAVRVLGRNNVFLKSTQVVETLAQVDAVVFDKTGTLTAVGPAAIRFEGAELNAEEHAAIVAVTRLSTHPYACRITNALPSELEMEVRSFREVAGRGIEGNVLGEEIVLGSVGWLREHEVSVPEIQATRGSVVNVAIGRTWRGAFHLTSTLRKDADHLLSSLVGDYELALLSGDNEKEKDRFTRLFGQGARLDFNQSPHDKLNYIRSRQAAGRKVMMVGDGLNDAGALQQSDAGVAVVESISAFSPASDVIISAAMVPRIPGLLRFAKSSVRVVQASFMISALYNVAGVAIAASGRLAPIVCAILMPVSSITVVAFASGATEWLGRRSGLRAEEGL